MISYLLFQKVIQFLIIMVIGFLLVKLRVVKSSDSIVLSKISIYLLMPASIIGAFQIDLPLSQVGTGLLLAFAAALFIHLVLLVADFGYKKTLKPSGTDRAVVFYSNSGNLIIPIVSYVMGGEWVVYSVAFLSVQLVFLWTHGVRLFSQGEKFNIKKIVFNSNIIAIVIGLFLMLSGLRLPRLADEIVSSLSGMLGSIGMLIAGMLAAQVNFKKALTSGTVYRAVIMRIIILPAIVLALLKLTLGFISIEHASQILLISFLASITPSAASTVQFSQIYEGDTDLAVSVNVITTVLCIATMPVFVMLFGA